MAFVPPDPNVFYPIPPGQLPPGFVPPPPGAAVRGIPIVVPHGLEMLISPEGFPVFVPERQVPPPPPYAPSPPGTIQTSPALQQQHYYQQGTPTPPSRHSTISSHHSSAHFTPPPPIPQTLASQTQPVQMPMPMPEPHYQRPLHPPPAAYAPPSHAPPSHPPPSHMPPSQPPPPLSHGYPTPTSFSQPPPQPPPQPQPSIPAGLTFASIVTTFRTSSEIVSAWTFYSLGLSHNPGQKEIAITLRQRPGNYTLEGVQPLMYQLFHQMNTQIQGPGSKPLAAGEIFPCRLDTPDAGALDLSILLVHAPPECKAALENKDVLYGLIATREETEVFSKYGAARTLANMGNDLETWPIPLWSDWSRPSLIHLSDFQGSLTEQVHTLVTKNVVATLDTISHRLTLVVSSSALEMITADLTRFPPAQPGVINEATRVTFMLDLDAGAQAYLTWRAGQEGPAIFNAKPNPTSFHGCWMSFTGIGPQDEAAVPEGIAPREDGIEVKMRGSTWERLYQALISRTSAVVPVGSETVHLSYA